MEKQLDCQKRSYARGSRADALYLEGLGILRGECVSVKYSYCILMFSQVFVQ